MAQWTVKLLGITWQFGIKRFGVGTVFPGFPEPLLTKFAFLKVLFPNLAHLEGFVHMPSIVVGLQAFVMIQGLLY